MTQYREKSDLVHWLLQDPASIRDLILKMRQGQSLDREPVDLGNGKTVYMSTISSPFYPEPTAEKPRLNP